MFSYNSLIDLYFKLHCRRKGSGRNVEGNKTGRSFQNNYLAVQRPRIFFCFALLRFDTPKFLMAWHNSCPYQAVPWDVQTIHWPMWIRCAWKIGSIPNTFAFFLKTTAGHQLRRLKEFSRNEKQTWGRTNPLGATNFASYVKVGPLYPQSA